MKRIFTKFIFNRLNKKLESNEEALIHLRIHVDKTKYHNTGVYIPESAWDNNFIKESSPSYEEYATDLINISTSAKKYFRNQISKKNLVRTSDVLDYLKKTQGGLLVGDNLIQYIESELSLNKSLSVSAKKGISTVITYLKEYDSDILISQISQLEIIRFERFLLTKEKVGGGNLSNNSVAKHMRVFKSVMANAIDEGLIPADSFYKIKTKKNTDTKKEWITFEEMISMRDAELPTYSRKIELIKDVFVFQFCTALRYGDVVPYHMDERNELEGLKVKHLHHTEEGLRVIKRPMKTRDKERDVNLNLRYLFGGLAEEVALRNIKGKDKEDYVFFKFLSLRWYNIILQRLADAAGIDKKVRSHTCRHSTAMNLLNAGMRLSEVSKVLSHSSITTTEVYARIINQTVDDSLREINDKFK